MKFSILGSGSRGNAVFVESKKTGVLIDAGFSGKQLICDWKVDQFENSARWA